MVRTIPGLHHVTAISGPPQANVDFYAGLLRQRLVKKTVNFDAPDTYHLYYGDRAGSPGTILTFFPFADAGPGRAGPGMAGAVAYAVPEGGLDAWMERLAEQAVDFDGPGTRFGEPMIAVRDPDNLRIELIETPSATPCSRSPPIRRASPLTKARPNWAGASCCRRSMSAAGRISSACCRRSACRRSGRESRDGSRGASCGGKGRAGRRAACPCPRRVRHGARAGRIAGRHAGSGRAPGVARCRVPRARGGRWVVVARELPRPARRQRARPVVRP